MPRADPAAKRLCISGTKVLLPRFTPPKLTIAVGPAKLVETLGFCWGFETGHTHGKSAAVVRRELFLRLDGPSARGHDFGVRLPAYRKEVLRYLREQGATEEQSTMMLRHFGSESAVPHRQPPFCLPRHTRRRLWSCHSPSINGSSSSRSATSSGCKFSFGSTDRVNWSFGPNSSGAWMI